MTPFEHTKCICLSAAALGEAAREMRAGRMRAAVNMIQIAKRNTDEHSAWRIQSTMDAYGLNHDAADRMDRIAADIKQRALVNA